MTKQTGKLYIGTSNIVVPGTKASFPKEFQDRTRLTYYASLFNTVELNSTFYKTPRAATFEKWSGEVPVDFKFSIKLSKEVTHIKELKFSETALHSLLEASKGMGTAKGCLLIQFPGKITLDYFSQVESVLEILSDNGYLEDWQPAVEFRSDTWYGGETNELLDQFHASLVLHDIPKSRNDEPNKGADFIYLRFHGEKGDYRGSYSDEFLQEKANRIKGWLRSGKNVYAYFNNTLGNAFENAMTLKRFCDY